MMTNEQLAILLRQYAKQLDDAIEQTAKSLLVPIDDEDDIQRALLPINNVVSAIERDADQLQKEGQ